MKKNIITFFACWAILITVFPAIYCQDVQVTIYNSNLGLVREKRPVVLEKGIQNLNLTDVAAMIDPTSVHLKSSNAPGFRVLEQNFQYDLISRDKLLQKYIGREIELEKPLNEKTGEKESISGKLLSTRDGIVMQVKDKILLNPTGIISLSKLPEELIMKPTLSLIVENEKAGSCDIELDYLTSGIEWTADYVAVVSNSDDKLDLSGWVTINNNSGTTYKDAVIKLIAGDVNRVDEESRFNAGLRKSVQMDSQAPQFQEKSFFEYHMYTLQRKSTIRDNETKQIEFTSSNQVPARKIYTFSPSDTGFYGYHDWMRTNREYGVAGNNKIKTVIKITNSKENSLGIALPKGRVRVYKEDMNNNRSSLEFIGEDMIDHTPKDESIKLFLGNAFDITGERIQANFQTGDKWAEESYTITLNNHKPQDIEVTVIEKLNRWSEWKIPASSLPYKKIDSRIIEFTVPVPKDSKSTITYTVKYNWR